MIFVTEQICTCTDVLLCNEKWGLAIEYGFVIYFFVLGVETYFLPAQHILNMLWTCETMNRLN